MPRIILKYKSPEFAETSKRQHVQDCQMSGCDDHGDHKAPKHRGLDEYYHFCVDHVKEYNKSWDFFSGMSERDVQSHMRKSHYGDRPTWKHSADGEAEEALYNAARKSYHFGDEAQREKEKADAQAKHKFSGDTNTPEHKAMALMGLAPPVTLIEIKTRYKTLAKKYHPDLNKDLADAEDLLKKINMAYTILKLAFEDYEKLPDHKL